MEKLNSIVKPSEESKKRVIKPLPFNKTITKIEYNIADAKRSPNLSRTSFTSNCVCRRSNFEALETYTIIKKVGKGSYSTVYMAHSFIHKTRVAMKETKVDTLQGVSGTTLREVSILKELKHVNIVCLLDIIYDHTMFYLVLEFAPYHLHRLQRKYSIGMPTIDSTIFAYQLLIGLAYCHEKNIIHRDIKPRNILITDKGILKIADFGLARYIGLPASNLTSNIITLRYRPPDILLGNTQYSFSADMWSTGCLISELFTSVPLFPGNNEQDQLEKIVEILGPINDTNLPLFKTYNVENDCAKICMNLSHSHLFTREEDIAIPTSFKNLISCLLFYNPIERATARECLTHPCFEMIFNILGEDQSIPLEKNITKDDLSCNKIAKYLSSNFFTIINTQKQHKRHK